MSEVRRFLPRLNTSIMKWETLSHVTAGGLTSSDIAGGLAGLARGPYLLVRYLWCGDHTVTTELYNLLVKEINRIAHKKNWSCKDDINRLKALVNMAMLDVEKINLCKPCGGTGIKTNQICTQCYGLGKKKRSQAHTARLCGIKPTNWKRSWEGKYQEVYLCILEWNTRGLNHLSLQI